VRVVLCGANELRISGSRSPLLSARAACRKLHSVDVQYLKPLPTTRSVARWGVRCGQPGQQSQGRGKRNVLNEKTKNLIFCAQQILNYPRQIKGNSISGCEFFKFITSVMDDHSYCCLAMPLPTTRRLATNPSNLMTRHRYTEYVIRAVAIFT